MSNDKMAINWAFLGHNLYIYAWISKIIWHSCSLETFVQVVWRSRSHVKVRCESHLLGFYVKVISSDSSNEHRTQDVFVIFGLYLWTNGFSFWRLDEHFHKTGKKEGRSRPPKGRTRWKGMVVIICGTPHSDFYSRLDLWLFREKILPIIC